MGPDRKAGSEKRESAVPGVATRRTFLVAAGAAALSASFGGPGLAAAASESCAVAGLTSARASSVRALLAEVFPGADVEPLVRRWVGGYELLAPPSQRYVEAVLDSAATARRTPGGLRSLVRPPRGRGVVIADAVLSEQGTAIMRHMRGGGRAPAPVDPPRAVAGPVGQGVGYAARRIAQLAMLPDGPQLSPPPIL